MTQKSYPVTENITVLVRAHADLALQGWEKKEVLPMADGPRNLSVQTEGEILRITFLGDGEVFIPAGLVVQVERVGGDAYVRRLEGTLSVERVGGDLALQDVRSAEISAVGGDCVIVSVSDSLAVHRVGGDLIACGISGAFSASSVSGDVHLQITGASAEVKAGGDLTLSLTSTGSQLVNLRAGGDISVYLPEAASLNANILSRGEDIRLRVAGGKQRLQQKAHQFTLGEGSAKINLQAGGDVLVTDEALPIDRFDSARVNIDEHWQDVDALRSEREAAEEESSFYHGEDISRRVNRHVEEAMRRADERIAAAMRRVEERTRQAGRDGMVPPMPPIPSVGRPRKSILVGVEPPAPPVPPAPPKPSAKSAVSEEERMLVLSMLQEKKITAEEAARLLEALERG